MKLWWGTENYHGIVVAANNLQDATSCIKKTKYFNGPQVNPNSIGFINNTEEHAYIICNSCPVQHDDFGGEPEDDYYNNSNDEIDDAGDSDLEV
jgi:hypothetical protein